MSNHKAFQAVDLLPTLTTHQINAIMRGCDGWPFSRAEYSCAIKDPPGIVGVEFWGLSENGGNYLLRIIAGGAIAATSERWT